jgi:5'-methylthioadenosine phosphorylase
MVTDFDCWHPDHEHVSVEQVIRVLVGNADKGRDLVKRVVPRVKNDAHSASCSCKQALEHALITAPDARDPAMIDKLTAVAGRVLKQ